jgi:hypothetical protein
MKAEPMNDPVQKLVRCAIYTRKSTEHNLDLAFTSLDAQREACEAYIRSQAGVPCWGTGSRPGRKPFACRCLTNRSRAWRSSLAMPSSTRSTARLRVTADHHGHHGRHHPGRPHRDGTRPRPAIFLD